MKIIVIPVLVGILVIFGLLATEIIDLRPDESTEVRKYEDLNKDRMNGLQKIVLMKNAMMGR